ncbi:hypothetical protein DQ397_000783 [Pseudomonas sp. CK-NBRI-02]|uniref:hypothetical protein n=1 Tax=Pseudomonas sp. CK-NBRI-02 TaxID=2249759 RepID=UPI0005B8C8F5|nr:hypothetical protein [Pseudomonas sp. CK-NBRI-02]TYO83696.1 hypothetical protein DQ397_000783 [Pseudomonas sp. CK-NBRI-02]
MTEQVLLQDTDIEITEQSLQEAADLVGILEIFFKDPAFIPPTAGAASGELSMQGIKEDVAEAIRKFFEDNKNMNICETAWDVFKAAAKAAAVGLTPWGGVLFMIIVSIAYNNLRPKCKGKH